MELRLAIIIIGDALLALFALYSAVAAMMGVDFLLSDWLTPQAVKIPLIFVVVSLFSSFLMEIYTLDRRSRKREIFITCLQVGSAVLFLLSVVYYLDPSVMLGQGVLFLAITLFIFYQFAWHALASRSERHQRFFRRVLILGTGELACKLGEIIGTGSSSFSLVGYLPCGEDGAGRADEVLDPLAGHDKDLVDREVDLLAAAHKARAGIIVVAISQRRGVLPLQQMIKCKLNGIEVVDAPTFYEIMQGKLMLEHITPSWIIFSAGFRRTALVNVYKRGIDICLAVAGILLTAPFFPVIALAIKIDSNGPLFFRQVRVGAGEKPFLLYKFRSMREDAERDSGAVWAVKNDSRITGVGQFFRNSRIDELPQLFNVLKGDMSFIGPRPERPEFVESLKRDIYYYSKRHTIKPGLTGWAQVRYPYGASVEDAVEKLRYDLYYIKNISVFLDAQIMFETVKVVLFGRGR